MTLGRRALLSAITSAAAAAVVPPLRAYAADLRDLGFTSPPGDIEAPPMDLVDLDGHRRRIGDYRGHLVLVSFWAVWCPPCRKEMPAMADLARRLHPDGFTLLAVNLGDRRERIDDFLSGTDHSGMTVLLDPDSQTVAPWHVRGLPVSYLLDRRGRIVQAALGAREWNAPAMIEALRDLARAG